MKQTDPWPRVAVVGAGAVGGYFGGMLARVGAPVVMIGRQAFAEAVNANGFLLDTLRFKETVRVEASSELGAVRGADVVLFCVKTTDNVATARELAPLLGPQTIVVSLQNGVDNVEQLQRHGKIEAIPAVVYVAASVVQPGHIKHAGRGDLVIGPQSERTRVIEAIFSRAGVPCRVSDNIEGEQWTKFLSNCALNAISALSRVPYGRIAANSDACRLVEEVIDEVLAVARARRVVLSGLEDRNMAIGSVMKLASQLAGALSSTAQDLARGKLTEIDALNGFIAQQGAKLGVPTPVNQALFTLVKLAEGE